MAYPKDPLAEPFAGHARHVVLLASRIETAAALRASFGPLGGRPLVQSDVDEMAHAAGVLRDVLDLCAGPGSADALLDSARPRGFS